MSPDRRSSSRFQALIFGDVFARTGGDLKVRHMHSMFGVTIEQIAKSLKPIRQALGIIEAIDADHEGMALDRVEEPERSTGFVRPFSLAARSCVNRSDRNRIDDDRSPFIPDRFARLPGDVEETQQAILEVVQMLARLEADDIIGQHHSQKLFSRGYDREDTGRHKRHVQKEADTVLDAERPQSFGEWDQMIIMHPDQIVRLQ